MLLRGRLHLSRMLNLGFFAKLFPNGNRITQLRGDVIRNVGFFVADQFIPSVFVLLADIRAIWVMMIFPQIQRIYSTRAAMN